jgi:hypothetical protein
MTSIPCPLCQSIRERNAVEVFRRTFYQCDLCDLFFADPSEHLSPDEEKKRYETHNNDVNDLKYQEFVRPLVEAVIDRCRGKEKGLDFGAGTGPVVAKLLGHAGFPVDLYDPFFWPDSEALQKKYDFIATSEVVEHFGNPAKEFALLSSLLESKGVLAIMTLLHSAETHFPSWYYLKDPTHICTYSFKTFSWIKEKFEFRTLEQLGPRVVVLGK